MGKHLLFGVFACFIALFLITAQAHAFQLTNDPQYIVMNFSEINELNWAAPENEWQTKIKPLILKQLTELQNALPRGTAQRKLAWSTLQEYMNVPMDTPSPNSAYVVKLRRILQIAEEINLPVFLPLNGFQWWDELPELYNWWDSDGTHTPESFFARQRTPDFKQRFIAGYNPENTWNVEWQNPTTPMKLNWRNWGDGGFRLAPPPNLATNIRAPLSYRTVQKQRFIALLTELTRTLDRWQKEGKSELFAGITIGTEISLNASVTSKDEFLPYGWRAIQDTLCPKDTPDCGKEAQWTTQQVQQTRQDVVAQYFQDLARAAIKLGIPKQRIYTHVWGEAKAGDPKFANYAAGAFTLYARPGMSFYGYAEDPHALPVWAAALKQHGNQPWGAVEYSSSKELDVWNRGMQNTLDTSPTAKVLVIYNWTEHKDTPAMQAIEKYLIQEPQISPCVLPEILPSTPPYADGPADISWSYFPDTSPRFSPTLTLHIHKGIAAAYGDKDDATAEFDPGSRTGSLPQIPPGVYTWYLELRGCGGTQTQYSEPRVLTVPVRLPLLNVPQWVRWVVRDMP